MSLLDFQDVGDLTLDGQTLFDIGDIGGVPGVNADDLAMFDVGDIGGIPGGVDFTDFSTVPISPTLGLPSDVVQNTYDLALQRVGLGHGEDPLAGFMFDTDTETIVTPSGGSVQTDVLKEVLSDALGINGKLSIDQSGNLKADPSWWQRVGDFTGLGAKDISQLVIGLGLGGIGFAIARGVAGGGSSVTLPTPTTPTTSVASRRALDRALAQPVGIADNAPVEIIDPRTGQRFFVNPVTGQEVSPTGAATTATGEPVFPAGTGEEQLQATLGAGLVGQRGLAEMLARTAYREGQAQQEMAPAERAIRLNALSEVPGLLVPPVNAAESLRTGQMVSAGLPGVLAGRVPRTADPIRAMLAQEIERAASATNPALDRQFTLEDQALENAMAQSLGENWRLSTPGYDAWIRLKESQSIRRDQDRRQTLATFSPLEESRLRLEYQAPLSAFSALAPAEQTRAEFAENLRRTGLGERTALTGFGRRPVGETSTGLTSLVPIQPLLGLGDAAAEARLQDSLRTQVALENFRSEQANRESLARGIAGIFGGATGYALGGGRNYTLVPGG